MSNLQKHVMYIRLLLQVCVEAQCDKISLEQVENVIQNSNPSRPNLLINLQKGWAIKSKSGDALIKSIHREIVEQANKLTGKKPLERIITGCHMLGMSCECFNRILYLGAAYTDSRICE